MMFDEPIDQPIELIPADPSDPRVEAALAELRELIIAQYPAATFTQYYNDDTDLIWLRVVVDVDDLDEVTDVTGERVVEMLEAGLPVAVVATWPPERISAELQKHKQARGEKLLHVS